MYLLITAAPLRSGGSVFRFNLFEPDPADMSLMKRLIIVEGNISAGKSTLCRMLSDELNYALFLEPTVENPFLDRFYKEPRKFALPMQLWLLKQRYITYGARFRGPAAAHPCGRAQTRSPMRARPDPTRAVNAIKFLFNPRSAVDGVILDRSIFSDIVFAERNFLDGNFTRRGYDYYLELRQRLLSPLPPPHAVVYLDARPEVCYDRIHNMRQRVSARAPAARRGRPSSLLTALGRRAVVRVRHPAGLPLGPRRVLPEPAEQHAHHVHRAAHAVGLVRHDGAGGAGYPHHG